VLGIEVRRGLGKCPLHDDRSASMGVRVYRDGIGWRCFAGCGSGDVLSLVASMHGLDPRADFGRVLEIGERLAGITPGQAPKPKPRRCRPVTTDPVATAWLESRCIPAAVVEDRDLARVLPLDGPLPAWAGTAKGSWRQSGHRLIYPTYDAIGAPISCQARHTGTQKHANEIKALSPRGCRQAGVFANDLARTVLATGAVPDWWGDDPLELDVAEGLPDFTTIATLWGDDERAPAVVGFMSGAWTREIAARIPEGSRVTIWEHQDKNGAGAKFTDAILQTFRGRRMDVRVVDERWTGDA
jgi:hypothetical protein